MYRRFFEVAFPGFLLDRWLLPITTMISQTFLTVYIKKIAISMTRAVIICLRYTFCVKDYPASRVAHYGSLGCYRNGTQNVIYNP
jgi:hypothetical protein